ncbi:MAG: hypothetical protein EOO14_07130 [Chitinophagaceae bacterium]|nr:MAG: hypothetical protein EOO14_07130 [Chitinophagaceae bacterium]
MKVLILITFISLISCKSSRGRLEEQVQTLELSYITWACDCANWATSSDLKNYDGDELATHCIYVEPASLQAALPDSIGYNGDKVRFTGQFYSNKGFPEGYSSKENPKAADVFRYTRFEILQSNFKEAKMLSTP